jgi:hypothetical protein
MLTDAKLVNGMREIILACLKEQTSADEAIVSLVGLLEANGLPMVKAADFPANDLQHIQQR